VRLGSVLALLALSGGGVIFAADRYLPKGETLPGLRVDGETVKPGTLSAVVEAHAAKREARTISWTSGHRVIGETTIAALGIAVDRAETRRIAAREGHTGDLLSRAQAADAARFGALNVPLALARVTDDAAAQHALVAWKEAVDVAPVSARLDLDAHQVTPEIPGKYVDLEQALTLAEAFANDASEAATDHLDIELPTASVAPRMSAEFLKNLDVSTVLADYTTYFSRGGDQSRRGQNIDNAAHKLDGLIMSPGQLVSFNEVVGERSEENGFQRSWEIFKGEMVEGVGGGTCQVASTFHAAVFFAGMDILERLPHSRPSAYIPMGLDSTVVYPSVDLKVRNPFEFPVVVHAVSKGNSLHIELLGHTRPAKVAFGREIVATLPYARKLVEDDGLHIKVRVKQHGIRGYRMKRERTITYANGTNRVEETTDLYPPTTEIYEVPVGFDETLLPPLPTPDDDDGPSNGAVAKTNNVAAPGATAASGSNVATVACVNNCAPTASVDMIEAPGAHKPTAAQMNPAKTLTLRR
jgi:vancomycin resistance protein YoaR